MCVFYFQAEDGIRDAHYVLEFRRVLCRSLNQPLGLLSDISSCRLRPIGSLSATTRAAASTRVVGAGARPSRIRSSLTNCRAGQSLSLMEPLICSSGVPSSGDTLRSADQQALALPSLRVTRVTGDPSPSRAVPPWTRQWAPQP